MEKKGSKKKPKDPSECVFCKILKDSPEKILFEDEKVFCFYDKKRKIDQEHILVCPKVHIQDTDSLKKEHLDLLSHIHIVCKEMMEKLIPGGSHR